MGILKRAAPEEPAVVVVMPAHNEEETVGRAISSIRRYVPKHVTYDVVVVDHGSCDQTAAVAEGHGALVQVRVGGTIGALRNFGVGLSEAPVIVFLDADVVVTEAWGNRLAQVLDRLGGEERLVIGSICDVAPEPSVLEKIWFKPRRRFSHLGSGHMIISRRFFEDLGGFDEKLVTGEDADLSARVVMAGGQLVHDEGLHVHHLGYPRTIRSSFGGRYGMGSGDFASLASATRSRVALATWIYLGGHAASRGGTPVAEWRVAVSWSGSRARRLRGVIHPQVPRDIYMDCSCEHSDILHLLLWTISRVL